MTTFDKFKTYCLKFCARTRRSISVGVTVAVLGLFSQEALAQEALQQQIRIDVTDTPLEQVLKSIEKQSSYTFFYNNEINVAQTVTAHVSSSDINAVVNDVLRGTGIAYRIAENRVVLYKGGEIPTTRSGPSPVRSPTPRGFR